MRVGLNLLSLVPGQTGGRETYARELIPALIDLAPELELVAFVNRDHPFYREVYKPLLELQDGQSKRIRVGLELMLIAAVRAEVALDEEQPELSRFRLEWSDTLATLLND